MFENKNTTQGQETKVIEGKNRNLLILYQNNMWTER